MTCDSNSFLQQSDICVNKGRSGGEKCPEKDKWKYMKGRESYRKLRKTLSFSLSDYRGVCEICKNNKSGREERKEKKARETERKSVEDEDPGECEDRRYHGPGRYSSCIPTWDAPDTRVPAEPVAVGCGDLPSRFHLHISAGKSGEFRLSQTLLFIFLQIYENPLTKQPLFTCIFRFPLD